MGHHQTDQYTQYGSPRRRTERERGRENIEITTENFPDLMKPPGSSVNSETHTETHNHTFKSQTQNLKSSKRETNHHKASSIRLTGFSSEILEVRKKWSDIFEELKEKNPFQPRLLYSAKVSFKSRREIRHSQIGKS